MKTPFPRLVWLLPIVLSLNMEGEPIPPQIQNLQSAQRPGTMYVDIAYDLVDPDSSGGVDIQVEGSVDGGANYNIVMRKVSGDIGLVTPGPGKKIVWNAFDDWPAKFAPYARVRVIADDWRSTFQTTNAPNYSTNVPPTSNLVWIPSGTFNMSGRAVWISRDFWMGKYEVTQEDYHGLLGQPGYEGIKLPMSIDFDQAADYCRRLTTRESGAGRLPAGWVYRLPTEAEWEYACRSGGTNTYYFGEDPNGTRYSFFAWFAGNAGGTVHPVGQKAPNRWGLYDMMGNQVELCWDGYQTLATSGSSTDPLATGTSHVVRGGSYAYPSWGSSARSYLGGVSSSGFRIVLVPADWPAPF